MMKKKRAPNRIFPVGFVMDKEEFMFRCFMLGAKHIHKRLSDKRVTFNLHNKGYFDRTYKNYGYVYEGRGMIWFNIRMLGKTGLDWNDWESECKKLKMQYRIDYVENDKGSAIYKIRLEW